MQSHSLAHSLCLQTSWTGFTVITVVVAAMLVGAVYAVAEYRKAVAQDGSGPRKKVSVKKTKREAMKRGMRGGA